MSKHVEIRCPYCGSSNFKPINQNFAHCLSCDASFLMPSAATPLQPRRDFTGLASSSENVAPYTAPYHSTKSASADPSQAQLRAAAAAQAAAQEATAPDTQTARQASSTQAPQKKTNIGRIIFFAIWGTVLLGSIPSFIASWNKDHSSSESAASSTTNSSSAASSAAPANAAARANSSLQATPNAEQNIVSYLRFELNKLLLVDNPAANHQPLIVRVRGGKVSLVGRLPRLASGQVAVVNSPVNGISADPKQGVTIGGVTYPYGSYVGYTTDFYDIENQSWSEAAVLLPGGIAPNVRDVRFQRLSDGQLFLIINKKQLFSFDFERKVWCDAQDLITRQPELAAGVVQIDPGYASEGDAIRMLLSTGERRYLYPDVHLAPNYEELRLMVAQYRHPQAVERYGFSFAKPDNGGRTPQYLIRYRYLDNRTGPRIFNNYFTWQSEVLPVPAAIQARLAAQKQAALQALKEQDAPDAPGKTAPELAPETAPPAAQYQATPERTPERTPAYSAFNERGDEATVITIVKHPYIWAQGHVLDAEVMTPERRYFYATVRYSDEEELIISYAPEAGSDASLILQCLDPANGRIKWTIPESYDGFIIKTPLGHYLQQREHIFRITDGTQPLPGPEFIM